MNAVTYLYPAPWCPIPITNQARGYTKADDTDVRRTIAEHSTLDLLDDYERTDALGYLEQPGAFR